MRGAALAAITSLLVACQPGVLASSGFVDDAGPADVAVDDASGEDATAASLPDAADPVITDAAPDVPDPPDTEPTPPPAGPPRYCERDGTIVMEAEGFSANEGYAMVSRADASGGVVMQVGERGALSFDIEVASSGRMYLWLRTLAPDAESNGVHVELDGSRIEAPADHPEAGSDDIYLQKMRWSWEPEWQGEGTHSGPVTFEVSAGAHRLTIIKRKVERPYIDRIALTWASAPPSGTGPTDTPCP